MQEPTHHSWQTGWSISTERAQGKWYLRVKTDTEQPRAKPGSEKKSSPTPLVPSWHQNSRNTNCCMYCSGNWHTQNSSWTQPGCRTQRWWWWSQDTATDFQTGGSTSSVAIYLGGVTPKAEVWQAAIVSWITDKQDYKADYSYHQTPSTPLLPEHIRQKLSSSKGLW